MRTFPIKYAFFLLLLSFCNLSGQEILADLRDFPQEKGTIIRWIPVNDSIWELGLKRGYRLTRQDLERKEDSPILFRDTIFPQSQSWFSKNNNMESGMIGALGNILYDSTRLNESWAMRENRNIRYRYIATEAQIDERLAITLGMAYLDTTGVQGRKYRYSLFLQGEERRMPLASIEIVFGERSFFDSTKVGPSLDITPPEGKPLTMMRSDFGRFNQIQALAKAYGDSVVLRWAPNAPAFWRNSNIFGYQLMRKELLLDSTYIPEEDGYILLDTVKPWSEEKFASSYRGMDSLVLVAAQCLYGKDVTSPLDGFYMQSSEENLKYGFALFAADNSSDAANALGLRFVDRNVVPGRAYVYHILSTASGSLFESAFIDVINVKDSSLDQVEEVSIDSLESAVRIQWSKGLNSRFSAFKIERSADEGKSFQLLTKVPLVFIDNPDVEEGPYYVFLDSLPENYKTYRYRIYGINSFANWSNPVEVIGMGIDKTPPAPPAVYFAQANLAGNIELRWEPTEKVSDLAWFQVYLANELMGDYQPVSEKLPASKKDFTFKGPLNTYQSHYFKIAAEDQKGNVAFSGAYFVNLVDSIPPAPPQNLSYQVDSTGVVGLYWDHGKERDLAGYRIYMANNVNHEFSQLTSEPIEINAFLDTIALNALDKEVFYQIVAVDKSHNLSEFSEVLVVNRPDILPPAPPVFLSPISGLDGIQLRWSPSPSNDLAGYILFRKNSDSDSIFTSIAFIDSSKISYTDSTCLPDILYEYSLRAIDQSGLYSADIPTVQARRQFDLNHLTIESFGVTLNTKDSVAELNWKYVPEEDGKGYLFYLYKKVEPEGWNKIKQFSSDIFNFKDSNISKKGKYVYGIKVVRLDGKTGNLTETKPFEIPALTRQ